MGNIRISVFCVAAVLATPFAAQGADLALRGVPEPPAAAPWNWNGLYVGTHTGAASGATKFSEFPGLVSIFGDTARTSGSIGGVQAGYNYQLNSLVLGIEADVSAADLDGTNTCFAFSGNFSSANCRAHIDALGSVTGRLGWAPGADGRTLLYLKGGAAWAHDKIDITINDSFVFAPAFAGTTVTRWGWTAGVGVGYALSPAWSAKLEYDYYGLEHANVATPYTLNNVPFFDATSQNIHLIKLGMNYKLAEPFWPAGPGLLGGLLGKAPPLATPFHPAAWEIEGGVRYWGSWSRFQKDLGGFLGDVLPPTANVSRLTYDGMQTNSGEIFVRVDNGSGVFAKGFIGGGGIGRGRMNDEDWGIDIGNGPVEYSNTLSGRVDGSNFYGTADVGYAFLRGPGYKVGPFIGYNYFRDKMQAFGCVQIANPLSVCAPPFTFPTSVPGITEDDTWQSLRLGTSAEVMLAPRLKLTTDAALLPYVKFNGTDHHLFLGSSIVAEVFPESGSGTGVQLEAILSYYLTDQLSIGVGGRYWAMRTTSGQWNCFGGLLCPAATPPQYFRGNVEQAGVLVQAAYKFAAPAPVVAKY